MATLPRPWYRLPLCWAGVCGLKPASDEREHWGECATCHRRFVVVEYNFEPAQAGVTRTGGDGEAGSVAKP